MELKCSTKFDIGDKVRIIQRKKVFDKDSKMICPICNGNYKYESPEGTNLKCGVCNEGYIYGKMIEKEVVSKEIYLVEGIHLYTNEFTMSGKLDLVYWLSCLEGISDLNSLRQPENLLIAVD